MVKRDQIATENKSRGHWIFTPERYQNDKEFRERWNARIRQWRRNNPEKARAHDRKRQKKRNKEAMERYRSDPEYRERVLAKVKRRTKRVGYGNRKVHDIQVMIDRDGLICALCEGLIQDPFDGKKTHVDHILPVSLGGTNNLSNRRLLHASCNLSRGNGVYNRK